MNLLLSLLAAVATFFMAWVSLWLGVGFFLFLCVAYLFDRKVVEVERRKLEEEGIKEEVRVVFVERVEVPVERIEVMSE